MVRMSSFVVDPNKREEMEQAHRDLAQTLATAIKGGVSPAHLSVPLTKVVGHGFIADDATRRVICEFVITNMDLFTNDSCFCWSSLITDDFDSEHKEQKLGSQMGRTSNKIAKRATRKRETSRLSEKKRKSIQDEEVKNRTKQMRVLSRRIGMIGQEEKAMEEGCASRPSHRIEGEVSKELIIRLLSYKATHEIPFGYLTNKKASDCTKTKILDALRHFWERGDLSEQKIVVFKKALELAAMRDPPEGVGNLVDAFFDIHQEDARVDAPYQLKLLKSNENLDVTRFLARAARKPCAFSDDFYCEVGRRITDDGGRLLFQFLQACGFEKVMNGMCMSIGFCRLVQHHMSSDNVRSLVGETLRQSVEEAKESADQVFVRLAMAPQRDLLSVVCQHELLTYGELIQAFRHSHAAQSLLRNTVVRDALWMCANEARDEMVSEVLRKEFSLPVAPRD